MATETTNAWAAGIVDGEGYITRRKHKRGTKTQPFVRVYNTDIRMLHKLAENYEGSVLLDKRKNRPNCKPCWHWQLCDKKCIKFLLEIKPYLVIKAEKAKEVLDMQQ